MNTFTKLSKTETSKRQALLNAKAEAIRRAEKWYFAIRAYMRERNETGEYCNDIPSMKAWLEMYKQTFGQVGQYQEWLAETLQDVIMQMNERAIYNSDGTAKTLLKSGTLCFSLQDVSRFATSTLERFYEMRRVYTDIATNKRYDWQVVAWGEFDKHGAKLRIQRIVFFNGRYHSHNSFSWQASNNALFNHCSDPYQAILMGMDGCEGRTIAMARMALAGIAAKVE